MRQTNLLASLQKPLNVSLLAGVIGLATTSGASANGRHHNTHNYQDFARVVHVEPAWRIEQIREPQRLCRPANQHHRPRHYDRPHRQHHKRAQQVKHDNRGQTERRTRADTAAFVGGVIGGIIGHHVTRSSNGHGNAAGTLAGAAIGATLAHNGVRSRHQQDGRYERSQDRHSSPSSRHRCTTTTQTREVRQRDGYNVTYVYRGNEFQTRMDQHPGKRLPVRISLSVGYH